MDFPKFLKIASLPYFQSVKINGTVTTKEVSGFYEHTLATIISQKLGFSYETVEPSDGQFGGLLQNGSWSGLMGMLERNEADLIIRMLSITEERSKGAEFSYPYFIDRLVFATRNLEHAIDDQAFIKPFSPGVWICLCMSIFVMPAVYAALFGRPLSLRHFLSSYRSFLYNYDYSPESSGEYVFRASWIIFKTVINWSYMAVLLSLLSVPKLSGVRNIPELANAVRRGTYYCTAYPGSFFADGFVSFDDRDFNAIGQSIKENAGYYDFDEALSKSEQPRKPAYIGEESRFFGIGKKYYVSEDGFLADYRAIGIKKGFCCKAQLDSTIHEIWASGIYLKLVRDFTSKEVNKILLKSSAFDTNKSEMRLSLADFQGVFIVLVGGYSVATLIFFIELIVSKSEIQRRMDNQK